MSCGFSTPAEMPWRGPVPLGATLGHALLPPLMPLSKFLQIINPPTGFDPIFRQCDQGITEHRNSNETTAV